MNSVKRIFFFAAVFLTLVHVSASFAQTSQSWFNVDTVKAGKFDLGKMWTFDYPPTNYFTEAYGFTPTEEWYNHVRMSALRFANYCSASFISADGLVMTNHHCGRQSVSDVTKEGENLPEDGFYAATLEDERKVPGLYVEQLVLIKDVTTEIQTAIDAGKTDQEKITNRDNKRKEIKQAYETETGLRCQVVTFFNGGKYSLYGYKRYEDVRLVLAPETQLGFFGGDPDNFTYPRYNLDFTFFRVYDENGKPLKTENYFKWSPSGAKSGEPVFVVGNPGSTDRLSTMAQLEFNRDVQFPLIMEILNGLVSVYSEMLAAHPERALELQDMVFSYANSQKSFKGTLEGLRNPYLMAKKQDFENTLKKQIMSKPELASKYGTIWDQIAAIRTEMRQYAPKLMAFNVNPMYNATYFFTALNLYQYALEMKMPEADRSPELQGEGLKQAQASIFTPEVDPELNAKLLKFNLRTLPVALGENDPLVKAFTGGKTKDAAYDYCMSKTIVNDLEKVQALIEQGPDAILASTDPFIQFIAATQNMVVEISPKMKALSTKEADLEQQLGRVVFDLYGTSIPPDATFTLRIADGIVRGYEYNGTTAPSITTFYGMYDRYYSFEQKFPWTLPERWKNPPAEFDLGTPMNFVSTNDIIGGNSGSPVINKNAEIVGLAFDGNIESLPGQFIFDTTSNRTVSVHSAGLLEAISDLWKVTRIAEEMRTGKIAK